MSQMQQPSRVEVGTGGNAIGAGSQTSLNGAQIQALQKQYQDTLQGVINDVRLREIALDHASKLAPIAGQSTAMELVRSIHEFLVEASKPIA
jgi:hypothetical protein